MRQVSVSTGGKGQPQLASRLVVSEMRWPPCPAHLCVLQQCWTPRTYPGRHSAGTMQTARGSGAHYDPNGRAGLCHSHVERLLRVHGASGFNACAIRVWELWLAPTTDEWALTPYFQGPPVVPNPCVLLGVPPFPCDDHCFLILHLLSVEHLEFAKLPLDSGSDSPGFANLEIIIAP